MQHIEINIPNARPRFSYFEAQQIRLMKLRFIKNDQQKPQNTRDDTKGYYEELFGANILNMLAATIRILFTIPNIILYPH